MKATVGEKGQVTIPKPLRDRMGLRKGSVLEFEEANGRLTARKQVRAGLDSIRGILPRVDADELIRELRGPDWDPRLDPERLAPLAPRKK